MKIEMLKVNTAIIQIKHQLDATLCGFYFCIVTLNVSGVKCPSSRILIFVPNMVMWWPTCNYNTCTRARRTSFLILLMMGAWRPKHVEWLCGNKTYTVLHQVGVLFDLYYDARKHKSKINTAIFTFVFALYQVKPSTYISPLSPLSLNLHRPLWRGIPSSHSASIRRFSANFHKVPQVAANKQWSYILVSV